MSKEEAIKAMQEGKKVRHLYFASDEWMTMKNGLIYLEDGVICDPEEFWKWRYSAHWKDGYEIVNK